MGDKRTTYLESTTWTRLDNIAADHQQHPATAKSNSLRKGSTAAVIEAIITDYDRVHKDLMKAQAEIVSLREQVSKLDQARNQAKLAAAQVTQMQAQFTALSEGLRDRLIGLASLDLSAWCAPAPTPGYVDREATRLAAIVDPAPAPVAPAPVAPVAPAPVAPAPVTGTPPAANWQDRPARTVPAPVAPAPTTTAPASAAKQVHADSDPAAAPRAKEVHAETAVAKLEAERKTLLECRRTKADSQGKPLTATALRMVTKRMVAVDAELLDLDLTARLEAKAQSTLPLPLAPITAAPAPALPPISRRTDLVNRLAVMQNALHYGKHADGSKVTAAQRKSYAEQAAELTGKLDQLDLCRRLAARKHHPMMNTKFVHPMINDRHIWPTNWTGYLVDMPVR